MDCKCLFTPSVVHTVAANNDVPLSSNAQKIFSHMYRQAAPIGNPRFWGAMALGSATVGVFGVATAQHN